ncbi:hypothetical protein AC579_7979 [Pseudocercospora musae]|uniref:Uncharacterized protein n=1 Tax=Pseudocercospora musae TaxID=113226 RepID=A0A139I064_9PEZI|nr:hypothetical protein AC579_7979 [Pseudocercospora musae]
MQLQDINHTTKRGTRYHYTVVKMCKVQQRIYKCNHSSEHHLSNCLNHTRCMAQRAWSGCPYITIFTALECPTCQFEAQKNKYMDECLYVMSTTRDHEARYAARRQRDDLTGALELGYPQMPMIISQNKRPGLRKHADFKVRKSQLWQSMTPDDCEFRRISRTFDINVFDDEEAEESREVGADGERDEDPMWDLEHCDRLDINPNNCAVDDDQENDVPANNTTARGQQHTAEPTSIKHVKLVTREATVSKVDNWKREGSGEEASDHWSESASQQLPTPRQSTPPSLTTCQAPGAPSSREENLDKSKWRDTDGLKIHHTGEAETTQIEPPPRNALRRAGFKKPENPMREYWRRKDSGEQMW